MESSGGVDGYITDADIFGEAFIATYFDPPAALTQALFEATSDINGTDAIQAQLGPDLRGRLRIADARIRYDAASEIAHQLALSTRVVLQQEVLAFIRQRDWLAHHLKPHPGTALVLRWQAEISFDAKRFESSVALRRRELTTWRQLGYSYNRDAVHAEALLKRAQGRSELLKYYADFQARTSWEAGRRAHPSKDNNNAAKLFETEKRLWTTLAETQEAAVAEGWRSYSLARSLYLHHGDYDAAGKAHGDAKTAWLKAGQQPEAQDSEAWELRCFAEVAFERKAWSDALEGYSRATDIWDQIGNERLANLAAAWACRCRAQIAMEGGDWHLASSYFEELSGLWDILQEVKSAAWARTMTEKCSARVG